MANQATPSVIVDDRSPLIQLQGHWKITGVPQEFSSTTTHSCEAGSIATFKFNGTSITVYGTAAPEKEYTSTMTFELDNSAAGSFRNPSSIPSGSVALFHQPLFKSQNLTPGEHTLVIKIVNTTPDSRIFFDYIVYTPDSPPRRPDEAYLVDDSDHSIQYANWTPGQAETSLQHTFHRSDGPGSKLTYSFEGTGISVNGDVPQRLVIADMASFSIDGGDPVRFAPAIEASVNGSMNTEMFKNSNLPGGKHTLVMETLGNEPLRVDYFVVTPEAKSAVIGSSTALSSSGAHRSRISAGAIAGSVIGGLVFIALILFGWFIWRRRKYSAKELDHGFIEPFREGLPSSHQSRTATRSSSPTVVYRTFSRQTVPRLVINTSSLHAVPVSSAPASPKRRLSPQQDNPPIYTPV